MPQPVHQPQTLELTDQEPYEPPITQYRAEYLFDRRYHCIASTGLSRSWEDSCLFGGAATVVVAVVVAMAVAVSVVSA